MRKADGLVAGSSGGRTDLSFDRRVLGEATFPSDTAAPAAARAAITRWLGTGLPLPVIADVRLLASELVANSVLHAGLSAAAAIQMRATNADGVVRVEVRDAGVIGAVALRAAEAHQIGGLGLRLVESLAMRWGVDRERGTRVWCEVPAKG
jgi:anti-sigma regulatory factor (Ser/Thr protein kinase)